MNTRNTKQKQAVMEALITLGHPTAAELHAYVKQSHPTVGLSTVYRILGEGAQRGAVRRITMPDADDIYDATLRPHSHARCRLCKAVFDVPTPALDTSLLAAKELGFLVETVEVGLIGQCTECQISNKNI